jgi:phage baseplate assembly protein V
MDAFETMMDAAYVAERLDRWYGVYPALVDDVRDPDGQGRVRVRLPWAADTAGAAYLAWARQATLMAGDGRGTWFVPEPGDEVLVAFEAGDPRRPFVLGALWNGTDAPPETMDGAGRNNVRVMYSRSGHQIRLDDTEGAAKIVIQTPGGQRITLSDSPSSVEITDASGNTARLEASGITVSASGKVTVTAATAEISAGTLSVNAGMSTFSGVVKADTVITNSVVSAAYTPGAGNIW